MRRFRILVAAAAAALAFAAAGAPVRAQGISQQQGEEILKELRAIRQLLERGAAAPGPSERVKLPPANVPVLGRPDAPVTMVEFTDLECPFCRQFHTAAFEQIKKNYIDTGKVRFVSRDLPLPFHPNARLAALAARCAADENKFWEMRHLLMLNGAALSRAAMSQFASTLGLDVTRFEGCLTTERHQAAIDRDVADAEAAEVNGTPTFVLGKTLAQGFEGLRIVGAQPYPVFEQKIRELLGER
jgi:protein-disulfide isomerase